MRPDATLSPLERWQKFEDRDALNELLRSEIEALKARIRGQAGSMLRATCTASDVAQDAVAGLLRTRKPPHFDNTHALRAYLWRSAWRLLVHRLRRAGPRSRPIDDVSSHAMVRAVATDGGLDAVESKERVVVLNLALNLLRPVEQEILRLVYFERRSIDDVARGLGIAPNAANMRLVRARRRLAERLAEWSGVIG